MTVEGYRVHRWGEPPTWERFSVDDPRAGEARVEVEACGVGLTVLNCINGDLDDSPHLLPRVPGHELVGRVSALGPGADPALLGRRVVAYFYLFCGECDACARGHEPRCSELAGWVGIHRDGGYASAAVLPARNLVPIPESLDPVSATVVPDAVATPVHVASRARIAEGDRVLVFGAGGGVGIHMVQVAAARGASVVGVDVAGEKLAAIRDIGIEVAEWGEIAGGGSGEEAPTVVVDLVGTTETTRWAIDHLAMSGRLICLTTFRDRTVPFESRELVFRELELLGSRYANRTEVSEAARLVADGSVRPVIGSVAAPDHVLDLHDALVGRRLIGRGALDWRET